MANSAGYVASSKIKFFYETSCHYDVDENLISSAVPAGAGAVAPGTFAASVSVVFKVQSILRSSVVGGNPTNEFLEEKDWMMTRKSHPELPWSRNKIVIDENHWREARQSCLDLPCSIDGLVIIIDDEKISETLTALGVPKVSHQSIIDTLRRLGTTAISSHHQRGLAPKVLVEIGEVTHVTLPLIDEQGKSIYPQGRDCDDDGPAYTEEEEVDQAQFADYLRKKLIFGTAHNNEEDEEALAQDWYWKLLNGITRVGWRIAEQEEKAAEEAKKKEEEEEKGAQKDQGENKEEDAKAGEEEEKGAKKERDCPICMETITLEAEGDDDKEAWRKVPCCSQVFHRECISMWTTERAKKCPWCRSSLPLVIQSAKGFVERLFSDHMYCLRHSGGVPQHFVQPWHLFAETIWWSDIVVHEEGCKCGCYTTPLYVTRA